jgi:hypothetical protein
MARDSLNKKYKNICIFSMFEYTLSNQANLTIHIHHWPRRSMLCRLDIRFYRRDKRHLSLSWQPSQPSWRRRPCQYCSQSHTCPYQCYSGSSAGNSESCRHSTSSKKFKPCIRIIKYQKRILLKTEELHLQRDSSRKSCLPEGNSSEFSCTAFDYRGILCTRLADRRFDTTCW